VLSERSEELLVARVLAAGIDEYLVQPIGERELTARIEAMLRRMRRYGGPAQTNQLGGMILSSSDLSAELDGRRTFLSPIEFRLLACLASAPGKVLTHQTLMARVWGAEYVDSRHYLRLYIRYLREKLEEDPAQPQMILSEWGVGYRFQPPEPSRR
jgi:two-component system KDP operon response regulator KdpE